MYTTKSRQENKDLHVAASEIIKNHLIECGYAVELSDNKAYNYIVNGKKCKVSAHQNRNGAVVVEYATDKTNMLTSGYDAILYMDITNRNRNKFYMAPVEAVADAINKGFGRSKQYFQITRKDIIGNSGLCIGINEQTFEKIEGVVTFKF